MTAATRVVETTAGGRPLLVTRPDSSPGQGSVDVLCTLARARSRAAGVCFLPHAASEESLADSVAQADVPLVRPAGWRRIWLDGRWRASAAAERARAGWRAAASSGLQELYREFRRHAGDERLPAALRRRLRETGHRCYERSLALRAPEAPYPRRLLRAASTITWAPDMMTHARAVVAAAGVPPDARIVAFEVRTRPDVARAAVAALAADGYVVVRIGDPGTGPLREPGLVDLTSVTRGACAAALFVLAHAEFGILATATLQQMAYLTNTPALTIDATDPLSHYPIRPDGLLLFATAIDLDSGRELPVEEWLAGSFWRQRRNCGFRGVATADLLDGIREMREGVTNGFADTDAQRQVRHTLEDMGQALSSTVPFVAEWGPDAGFLGDGRLARIQAERAA